MSSSDYRYSRHTPDKQRDFEAAIDLNLLMYSVIARKYKAFNPSPYLYIDLNSGVGIDPEGLPGSPIVFLETAFWHHIKYEAEMYEVDPHNAKTLFETIENRNLRNATVFASDHKMVSSRHAAIKKYQYGAVYADPSNAELPFDLLMHLSTIYPRLDIIINLACASYKRSVEHPDYVPLDTMLPKMKRYWKIREPIGKHQWSILVGTNWNNYPDLEPSKWRFHDIRTTVGRKVYETLVYTKRQLDDKNGQSSLWGDSDE